MMPARTAAALAAALTLTPAAATNWSVFSDAPVTRMSEADLAAYRDTIVRTLEKGQDGKTVEWNGKEKGTTSKITPLKSFQNEGWRCRDLRLETRAKELKASGTYVWCKMGDNWEVRLPASTAAPDKNRK